MASYDIIVNGLYTDTETTYGSLSTGGFTSSCTFGIYHWPCTCNTTYYWNYPYQAPIYMYQLKCPQCKKMNWGQLNIEITCKGCKSTLKAVSKTVDYEIEVDA